MANATQNQITEALKKLDSGNDAHWTDDGLPQVAVIRELTNDSSLKRADIEKAVPGFARAGTEADANSAEADTKLPGDPAEPIVTAKGDDDGEGDEVLTDERDLREAMKKRIDASQDRLVQANEALRDAAAFVKKCQNWHAKAIADFSRRFPPMTSNQALKEHLARQQQYKNTALNPIDEKLMSRRRPAPKPGLPVNARGTAVA